MIVDLAVPEEDEEALDFLVADGSPQPDTVNIGDRHEHGRFVCYDAKVIEAAGRSKNGFLFDSFDNAQTMVRVDDLVSDLKCHGSPCWKRAMEGRNRARQ